MEYNLTRKGTVSKSSGPTHSHSYAMRGVPVRYKPPIFVPELLQLPASWVKPTLPSGRSFNYDYRLERRVAELAKHRALSIAAEASLQRKQIAELLKKQQQEEEDKKKKHHPPFMPSSTEILTPTPVAPPTSQSSPVVGRESSTVVVMGVAVGSAQSGSSSGGEGSSTSLIEDETRPTPTAAAVLVTATAQNTDVLKSLGNWSIKEFEGEAMDPFEIASLQAINDMEELQSVLQTMYTPVPSTSNASPNAGTVPVGLETSSSTPTVVGASAQSTSGTEATIHSSPSLVTTPVSVGVVSGGVIVPASHTSSSNADLRALTTTTTTAAIPVAPRRASEGNPYAAGAGGHSPLSTSPLATGAVFNKPGEGIVSTNPFASGAVQTMAPVQAAPISTNPFARSEQPPAHHFTPFPTASLTPQLQQPPVELVPPRSHSEPGVATLVDLSGSGGDSQVKAPVPAPRSPKVQPRREIPVPKPRKSSPGPAGQGGGVSQAPNVSPKPVVSRPPAVQPHSGGSSPVVASRIAGSSSPQFPPAHNHISRGVPVLPPIAQPTSSAHPPQPVAVDEPPPAYRQKQTPPTSRKSPPPPYSSPSSFQQRQLPRPAPPPPAPRPKAYTLPDPEGKLSAEQKQTVQSISSMGFPPARVGRAMLRFENDQTKVLDFLFLVGELEEAKFHGNSAETALIACKDKLDDAKQYLQKLEHYKDIGFEERNIHKAYTESGGDWDKALDTLTTGR